MNKKSNFKIVFMGTPDFAAASLNALVQNGFEIAAVVTAPDRPAGRGQKLKVSAVKEYALNNGLLILQPQSLKDPEFISSLNSLNADLQIVVAFRMLPKEVWSLPKLGTFNLHASLLPDYRGAAPINWAIINGEKETGVTTFFIDEEIDTGNIIIQEKITIESSETAGQLHDRLMKLGAQLVVHTAKAISEGNITTISQKDVKSVKMAPKLFKETCKLDWNRAAQEIYNKIRGLSPYPAAWGLLNNGGVTTSVKIFKARLTELSSNRKPGSVEIDNTNRKILVHTLDQLLELEELQLEGKSRLRVSEALNGLRLDSTSYFY
jgi:methionyl-tRNA formyltransferase